MWVANPTRRHRVCEYARCPVCRHSKLRKADRVTPADPITRVATVRRRLVRPGSAQVHGRCRDWSGDGQSLPEPPPTTKCRAAQPARCEASSWRKPNREANQIAETKESKGDQNEEDQNEARRKCRYRELFSGKPKRMHWLSGRVG